MPTFEDVTHCVSTYELPRAANTPAARSSVCRHHRWQIRPPSIQRKVRERNLKVREPSFVPSIRVSGEKARTKDDFFTPHPDFWGDCPDEVTLHTPWQHFGRKASKVYRKTMLNVDFEHRLPLKQPKSGQGVSRHLTPQAQIRMFNDTQSHRQKSE